MDWKVSANPQVIASKQRKNDNKLYQKVAQKVKVAKAKTQTLRRKRVN